MSAAWSGLQRDERGSVLLLGIGMIVVGILAVAVAVDVSAAFLQRRALMSLGDSAALAGAQSIDLDSYYANGASIGTRLSPVAVASAARRQVGIARGSDEITIESITTDGITVRQGEPGQACGQRGGGAGRAVIGARAFVAVALA